MNDLISVIVPVYNAEDFLDECMDSIAGQTYERLEIILIDDGSKDSSPMLCDDWKEKDNRVVVIHRENAGVSSARNLGLDIAKGTWVTFMDADDVLEPHYIEYMYMAAILNDAPIGTCTRQRFVDFSEINWPRNKDFKAATRILDREETVREAFKQGGFLPSCTNKVFSLDVLKDENDKPLRFVEDIYIGEDLLFSYQAFMNAEKLAYVQLLLYAYRHNPDSASNSSWNYKWDSTMVAHGKICEMTKEYDQGKFYPHIFYQEACVSLFIRRYRSGNPMDTEMKKHAQRVVRDRWLYLIMDKDIHPTIKIAAIPMLVHPRLAEITYDIYLRLIGAKAK